MLLESLTIPLSHATLSALKVYQVSKLIAKFLCVHHETQGNL